MKKKITYTQLIVYIIILSLSFSLIIGYLYSEYLKNSAIKTITKENSQKTSKLVFQTLFSAMEKGWTKNDINNINTRLNQVDNNLKIKIHRTQKVIELYGNTKDDIQHIIDDKSIHKVLEKKKSVHLIKDNIIQYYYPLIAQKDCLQCHTNSKSGDILGIIDIEYTIENLKSSMASIVNFFFFFLIILIIILFISLFSNFYTLLIKPINLFIHKISNISKSKDISKRIHIKNNIEEIGRIQAEFNHMLDIIEKQLYYDELTHLPNRKKLLETLDNIENSILMIINIDKFQEINDLYGEEQGDKILKEMAKILKSNVEPNNILYKLHADEYALLYDINIIYENIKSIAQHINMQIENYVFNVNHQDISINATIGVSYGSHLLLNNADIALKLAKKRKINYLIYDSSMNMEYEYEQNLKWSKRIKEAIDKNKIIPLFQPIINVKTKQVEKYEALIRILDEYGNYISPINFLEHARKNKLYSSLTMIMIEKSFDISQKVNKQISINLSMEDILNEDITKNIIKKLAIVHNPHNIVFELLESENIENSKKVESFINDVKKLGAKISIDDFGTGYSNFEYLTTLNIDYIKIDASLIKNINSNKKIKLTTETIINFSKKMGIQTIAEFVHSEEVFDAIEEMGIDYAQGYFLGEPKEFD